MTLEPLIPLSASFRPSPVTTRQHSSARYSSIFCENVHLHILTFVSLDSDIYIKGANEVAR